MAITEVTSTDALVSALKAAQGGDVISAQGAFGAVTLKDIRPAGQVTIDGSRGAHFERIDLTGCMNLHFDHLSLWPLGPVVPPPIKLKDDGTPIGNGKANQFLIMADPTSANIEVSNCIFRGRKDSDGHPGWAMADWKNAQIGAALMQCPGAVIRSNKAIGIYFGFTLAGKNSELFDNHLFGFAADGLRLTEDNCVCIGNRVTDAVRIDGNHPDAIQAFKRSGPLKGIIIKDNVLLEWTVRNNNPLRAKLQGIGFYDGPYSDVVIRDNKVAISSPNGIRINATTNITVTGNRVRHIDHARTDYPRIMLTGCSGLIDVSNNRAEKFVPPNVGTNNGKPNYSEVF